MKARTVILAAGEFPRKGGEAWRLLAFARRVVACDSAANAYRRRFRRWPTVVIGDLDSFREGRSAARRGSSGLPPVLIRVCDQTTNDLEKAITYCTARGWTRPVIVGATGKREDHALGNVFRGLAHGLEIVTDSGRFVPVCGSRTLRLKKGAAVSIFAPDQGTRMSSKGLAWPLDGVTFENLYCATLNRASSARVALTSTKPVYVFVAGDRSQGFRTPAERGTNGSELLL